MKKTVFGLSLEVLAVSLAGIIAFIMVPAFFFMNSLYYDLNRRNLTETAKAIFLLSSDDLADYFSDNSSRPPGWINKLVTDTDYRITLIGIDGKVRADTHLDPRLMDNHQDRPEVREALLGRPGEARRQSESINEEQLYIALSVKAHNSPQTIGVFRLSKTIPSFGRRIYTAAVPFMTLVFIVAAAAFAAIYFFSRSLSRAVSRLVSIMQAGDNITKIAADHGSLEKLPLITETQEFTRLEIAMFDMAAELRNQNEQAVIEQKRLEAILNGMTEAVFAADSRLNLILINNKARLLFEINNENNRVPAGTILEATGSIELEDAAKKVLSGSSKTPGTTYEFEMKWYRGGKRLVFQVYAAPFVKADAVHEKNNEGFPEGVIIVLNDVTRLQQLEQVRQDFAANVSHELRTPIQIVKGFAEIISDSLEHGTENKEQLVHCIELITKNIRTMENLTHDLLTLVSLEDENGQRPDMTNNTINTIFEEAVQSVQFLQEKKNIKIIQLCPPGLSANLHGPLIIQALVNLLDNAIQYTPEGGMIRLNAAVAKTEDKNELVLSVIDEGSGIPAEHLDRLFERFYRVDKARSRNAGGTGLGLAIVRHIALAHNGIAEAESHAGEGSVFSLRIPLV